MSSDRNVLILEGRPLDLLVAQEVMGDRLDPDGHWVGPTGRVFGDARDGPDRYSQDPEAAFRVVAEMRRRGFVFALHSDWATAADQPAGNWNVKFAHRRIWTHYANGPSACVAICRAAVVAGRTVE